MSPQGWVILSMVAPVVVGFIGCTIFEAGKRRAYREIREREETAREFAGFTASRRV